MKDQYFGDINDYRKYGLLRCIIEATKLRAMVAWMLTPNDGSTDGKFIQYLEQPDLWSKYDPDLFNTIRSLLPPGTERKVSLIEHTRLLSDAHFFSDKVPDSASDRERWFVSLSEKSKNCDLVFLDPDNGLEVKSRRYGRKNSSKYVYWREVKSLWKSGKSLLIYQHFIRKSRDTFKQHLVRCLQDSTPGSSVDTFSTPNVVFLMALQPEHKNFLRKIVTLIQEKWQGQILHQTDH